MGSDDWKCDITDCWSCVSDCEWQGFFFRSLKLESKQKYFTLTNRLIRCNWLRNKPMGTSLSVRDAQPLLSAWQLHLQIIKSCFWNLLFLMLLFCFVFFFLASRSFSECHQSFFCLICKNQGSVGSGDENCRWISCFETQTNHQLWG